MFTLDIHRLDLMEAGQRTQLAALYEFGFDKTHPYLSHFDSSDMWPASKSEEIVSSVPINHDDYEFGKLVCPKP